jgi:hypothetical protein
MSPAAIISAPDHFNPAQKSGDGVLDLVIPLLQQGHRKRNLKPEQVPLEGSAQVLHVALVILPVE